MKSVMEACARVCGKVVRSVEAELLGLEDFPPAFASAVIHRGSPREGRQAFYAYQSSIFGLLTEQCALR